MKELEINIFQPIRELRRGPPFLPGIGAGDDVRCLKGSF